MQVTNVSNNIIAKGPLWIKEAEIIYGSDKVGNVAKVNL